MTIFLALAVFVLGFVAVAQGSALRGHRRYADPQLHSGWWELKQRFSNTTVYRARYMPGALPDTSPGHTHRPHECTITDGLIHLDKCACGAERSGVYGAWA